MNPKRYPSDLTRLSGNDSSDCCHRPSPIARGGWAWRMVPKDLPPWSDALRTQVRHRDQRKESPSMIVIDTQSAKTTEPVRTGFYWRSEE